jgi:chromate transporter
MKFYLQLFWSFFKIGTFTLGGGYMMIPLIEQEIVGRRRWISADDFTETLTLAQSAPGPIAINTAVFVGYKMRGMKGMLAAVSGVVIPAFTIILLIATFFPGIRDNEVIARIFKGLRPAVVALIAVSFVRMLQKKNFAWKVTLIAAISAFVVSFLKISPIIVILIAGVGGIIYYLVRKKHV